jgi:hypothetical protein
MHSKPPGYQEVLERSGPDHIRYMIDTWFVRYANVWYSGPRDKCHECHAEANRLNRAGVGKFAVAYEY